MTEFVCEICKEKYDEISENPNVFLDELAKEIPEFKDDETVMICEDCYKPFKKWFDSLSTAEKKEIRNEYNGKEIKLDKNNDDYFIGR